MAKIDNYANQNTSVLVIGGNPLGTYGLGELLKEQTNIGIVTPRLYLPNEDITAMINGLSFKGIDVVVIYGHWILQDINSAVLMSSGIRTKSPEQPLVFTAPSDPYLTLSGVRDLEGLMQLDPKPGFVFYSADDIELAIHKIAKGIDYVLQGQPYTDLGYLGSFKDQHGNDHLSARETEVLRLVAMGYTNKEIGVSLAISAGTARTHVAHIIKKFDAKDRIDYTSDTLNSIHTIFNRGKDYT